MRATFIPAALAIAVAGASFLSPSQAEAAGCIKGAIVGGIAGHFAGHGLLGAGAGCVVGRANANRTAQRDRAYEPNENYQPNGVSNYQRPQPYNGSDARAYDQRGDNSQGYNQNNGGYNQSNGGYNQNNGVYQR